MDQENINPVLMGPLSLMLFSGLFIFIFTSYLLITLFWGAYEVAFFCLCGLFVFLFIMNYGYSNYKDLKEEEE